MKEAMTTPNAPSPSRPHDPRTCLWCENLRRRAERGMIDPQARVEELDLLTNQVVQIHVAASLDELAERDGAPSPADDPELSVGGRERQ
jgi:hypothetical protein